VACSWLSQALALAPEDATDLVYAIRMNLAIWSREISPLRAVLSGTNINWTIWRWDATSGKALGLLLQQDLLITSLTFSRDGKAVLVQNYNVMYTWGRPPRLWDVAAGKAIGHPTEHLGHIAGAALGPDGDTILMLEGADIDQGGRVARLWSATVGKHLGQPIVHPQIFKARPSVPTAGTCLRRIRPRRGYGTRHW